MLSSCNKDIIIITIIIIIIIIIEHFDVHLKTFIKTQNLGNENRSYGLSFVKQYEYHYDQDIYGNRILILFI